MTKLVRCVSKTKNCSISNETSCILLTYVLLTYVIWFSLS